jgi:putative ABC transport system permease protein
MRKSLNILATSFRMAWEELGKNKLRSFLSLFGITIGIFCIIAVLATVSSLQATVQNVMKSVGTNTVYIQKWPWDGGNDFPWWKYLSRPEPSYNEMKEVQDRAAYAENVAFVFGGNANIVYGDDALSNVNWQGISEEFDRVQPVEIAYGRYILPSEFNYGAPVMIMGATLAEKLFGDSPSAIGKVVTIKGHQVKVIGVTVKQGNSLIKAFDFDQSAELPYLFCINLENPRNVSGAAIMVKGRQGVPLEEMRGQLLGIMRSVRRLSPRQEDNFTLNDFTSGASQVNAIFGGMTMGGFAITGLSFIVGIFGVANIMFVSVRERTPLIGLKKAIGAKKRTILVEFLIESAFLCVLGGMIGISLVFGLTFLLSSILHFTVTISPGLFAGAVLTCIFTGILAGIIPASIASRMDPVVAIRS